MSFSIWHWLIVLVIWGVPALGFYVIWRILKARQKRRGEE